MTIFPIYNKQPVKNSANFVLDSNYEPAGDQPQAIAELVKGINAAEKNQVLLGVTGSGKTFTMAQVIKETKRPALIMAPNKILAAQLYAEMKQFFPKNAVEYFVSYYDYYQPEAYVPKTDTYIEKDSAINEQIDRMRHSATRNLLEREDAIIVASVSCIYGLGSVESYSLMKLEIEANQTIPAVELAKKLVELQFERNEINFVRGSFRIKGDILEIFPIHYEDRAWRISFFGDLIEEISEFDPLTGKKYQILQKITVYPASHYVTPRPTLSQAMILIKEELKEQLAVFEKKGMLLEAERLKQRTNFDLEMIETIGACKGIENYSRYLTGRKKGEPPPTLFEYLPENAILFVDESHITVPQIGAMYKGDFARKSTLADYGFRLPSCLDNRPLKFEEWDHMRPQTIFVSATPADFELKQTKGVFAEQVIRPTGLTDPVCVIRPAETQVDDLIKECKALILKKQRALVTTLTKKMAENLTEYLNENNVKARYMHSDVDTLERIQIIKDLRLGVFDVLVGINLLREGLDIPECALVAILDADKEGFLRSKRSLIQTIGRAARNIDGIAILYADNMTNSIKEALDETNRRREKQLKYNLQNNITPQTIKKNISDNIIQVCDKDYVDIPEINSNIEELEKQMYEFATNLEFEKAAEFRDKIKKLGGNV